MRELRHVKETKTKHQVGLTVYIAAFSFFFSSPEDRPINLRVVSQSMQEGELPLGKQLANELKRHHNHNHTGGSNGNNTDDSKTPATGDLGDTLTMLSVVSQHTLVCCELTLLCCASTQKKTHFQIIE